MTDLAQALSEIKSLPDSALQKELASPTGMLPGYLVLGEMHERKRLRAEPRGPDPTKRPSMAEEYMGNAQRAFAGSGQRPPPQPPPPQPPPQMQAGGIGALPQAPQGYAEGGIVSLARGGRIGEIEAYIRSEASRIGIDPDIAVRVAQSEGGLSNPFRQGESMLSYGREQSYGPLQLHIRQGGLGTRALAAGIDPRVDWKGGVTFGLTEAKNRGWGQWYGAAKSGIGDWAGIGSHGGGVYPKGGNPISAATEGAGAGTSAAAGTVAASAADTAGKMAAAENAETADDPMAAFMLMQQMLGSGQQQAPAPAPMAVERPKPQFRLEDYLRRGSYG